MGANGGRTDGDPPPVKQIVQRAASDWLSLRRPADEDARRATTESLIILDRHLSSRTGPGGAVIVVDLGAGTGANMAWLSPRLTVPQRWTLVDRDVDLLALAPRNPPSGTVLDVRRVTAELDDLQRDHMGGVRPDLVTCSALLDVLTVDQVSELAGFVVLTGAAALFSLTVTGSVTLVPGTEHDRLLNEVFNAHQERHGLAGPHAMTLAGEALGASGYTVVVVETPWVLGPAQFSLAERYLVDRVDAVVEHDQGLAGVTRDWLAVRLAQLRDGALSLEVGHRDLLALPPSP